METSKKVKLILLVIILIGLILALLGVFLYDILHANRIRAELTQVVEEFHESGYVYIDGNRVIGIIEIERLGIKYPIIQYVNISSLDITICKYAGPDINELGNVSLLGHNMRSGIFFTRLTEIEYGDVVQLTNGARLYGRI
ncbi:MAG: sortase [Oscillospiraceae bacterium]|nr:sortase [Oscillospiraceae bacterium]